MRRAGWTFAVVVALAGCGDGLPPPEAPTTSVPALQSRFDPSRCGQIAGRVRWSGAVPQVPALDVERFIAGGTQVEHVRRPNPHAPQVSPDGNLAGAVVFLRGIDPTAARPWDHPPVTIEMHDERPIVRQGDAAPGLVGFVRKGDAVTMGSKQPTYHAIRARGSAFFTLTLPDPDKPRRRPLREIGRVELTSAAGHTAMRGHLFVDEHPYYAVTDADGRFTLTQVPAGSYDLVCWRPDWRVERLERDPETLLRVRLFFLPPREAVLPVTVRAGEAATVLVEVGSE